MNLEPYLFFNGNCREAMNFYKGIFGGELNIMDFASAPGEEVKDEDKNRVMHAILKSDNIVFMASDSDSNHGEIAYGANVFLCLNTDDVETSDRFYNALSAGGKQSMPMENTFWGAYFGMLTDKFGQNWMISCQQQK